MSKLALVARVLMGLIFFVFGLNGFLNFIPMPPLPEQADAFMGALAATGYFFPVLKITEIICGALLLTNFFAPLALVILSPIIIQIVLFHGILTPGLENLAMPIILVVLSLILAVSWKHKYAPLLQAK